MPDSLIIAFLFFIGYTTQGLTGFGGALIAVPLVSLLISPQLAVIIFNVVSIFIDVSLVIECRKHIKFKRALMVTSGALVGIPLGTFVLIEFASVTILRIMGVIIIMTCILFIKRFNRKVKREGRASVLVGILSGAMAGATGMGGPPMMFWGLNQQWEEHELRANNIAYFSSLKFIFIPLYLYTGQLNWPTLLAGLPAIPGMVAGFFLALYLKEKMFARRMLLTRLVLVLLLLTGISIIVRSFL